MPSINYKQVYSRFYTKVQAYDFVYDDLDADTIEKFLCSYLHSSISRPEIRKLFLTISLNDDATTITYQMKYTVDPVSDMEFIEQIIGDQMVLQWLKPKVSSLNTIIQHFSTSESKFFSQSQHLEQLRGLYSDLRAQVRSLISDRGGANNAYLDGTSASSSLISQ